MFKKYKRKIFFAVISGALIFLAFSVYADFNNLISAFGKFNWIWMPVILALSFCNYIFRFFKWHYYTKILKIEVRFKSSFLIFLSSFTMSVTPGKMGELLKSYLLKEETGTPVAKSAPIIFAERITDFISIVILCLLGALVFDYGKIIIITIGIIFILIVILLSIRSFSLKLISVLCKIKIIAKHSEKLFTAYESIYQLIRIKPLIYSTFISLISWFFECLGFYIVLSVFSLNFPEISVSLLTATFIYGFSTLIGAIAMLPGGLGATEATITGLLVYLKIPKDISVASTILIRVATLWFAVLIGIIFLYIYQKHLSCKIEEIS